MAIFNSYVCLPEGKCSQINHQTFDHVQGLATTSTYESSIKHFFGGFMKLNHKQTASS